MRTTNYFKGSLLHLTLVTTVLLMASCGGNQKPEDTKDVAEEHNEAKFDDSKHEKDAEFLVHAAEINLEEIQLAQLAQLKGSTLHVRELGKMMEEAHAKSQKDLFALATRKGITIPGSATDDAKEAYTKLNEKSGIDFDRDYADMMVNGHKKAIAAFEKALTECNDTEIKDWANATLPELRKHLDHAIDCQKKCEKK